MRVKSLGFIAVIVAAAGSMSSAAVLLDQIGPTAAGTTGQNGSSSQRFEAANAAFHVVAGDNFVVPAGGVVQLTSVDVVLLGFATGFTAAKYTDGSIQDYEVQIYSTSANAQTNLTGNVASFITTGLTGVTTTVPFGTDALRALVSINLSTAGINLAPGNYSIGIIPRMDFTNNGQTAVSLSTFGGGGGDGFQANPGGGFGLPGNLAVNQGNFAYRINATPAPGALALLGLGGLIVGRRRR